MSKVRTINISLPEKLVEKIDIAAEEDYASRSEFIRDSIVRKLEFDNSWEVVADFTDIKKGGVDIGELIKRL